MLGPLFTNVTVAVAVLPAIRLGGKTTKATTSETGFTETAALLVLLAGLLSPVVVVTAALKVCTVVLPAGMV